MPGKPRKLYKSPPTLDARERAIRLNIFRRGLRPSRDLAARSPAEPIEYLEDSDLSDGERNAAIARERMRREGLI